MGRSRDIADILSKTELANTNNERLIIEDTVGVDSAYVSANLLPALAFYSTLDSLPVTGLTVGQQAYVDSNNRLYISDGSGWYNKAFITLTPTITLDPSGTIVLSNDGVTTSTVTVVAVDSDTPGSGLTYSVDSDGNGIGKYVISQDSSVFTIRPLSEDSGATTGTFTLTFSTTDGDNIATDSSEFSLTFAAVIDSSAPTVLLMKAAGNSATNAAITYQNSSDVSTGFTEAGDPQASSFSPYRSGGYSTYFDGSGDYLNPKTALDGFTSTSDPWTIEFWIYNTGPWTTGYPTPIGLSRSSDGFNSFLWGNPSSASNDAIWFNNTTASTLISTVLQPHEWTHVALVYTGTQVSVYYNGTQVLAPVTIALGTALSSCEFGIGAEFDGANGGSPGNYHKGYMTEIRVSDIARYTTAFTAPTEALTDDDDTVFLLSQNDGYFKDASGGAALNLAGDVKKLPFGPYDYEVWSLTDHGNSVHFDGTGDYITPSAITAPGTGAVTYEAWVRQENGGSSNHTIFDASTNGFGGGNGITVQISSNACQIITSDGINTAAGTQFQDEVWHHVAVVRNASNSIKYYVDGVAIFTGLSYSGNTTSTSCRIGATNAATPGNLFQGYIANARVTNAEVYTSNFTPPTAPLTGISNTQLVMYNGQDANVYDAASTNVFKLTATQILTSTSIRKFTTSSSVYTPARIIDVPATELFAFGASDFTWESWIYHTVYEPAYLLEFGTGGDLGIHHATAQGHLVYYNSTTGTGSTLYTTGFGSMSEDTWYHIAAVRINGTTYLYTDGVLQTSATDSHNYGTAPLNLRIAGYGNGGTYRWSGYLQDLRITKGKGRYTAAFTPPTAEFEL